MGDCVSLASSLGIACLLSVINIRTTDGVVFDSMTFGEWQSDMNDGVIYDITNNSTKTIVFGANLSKNIVEKNLFFKYGKTLIRI